METLKQGCGLFRTDMFKVTIFAILALAGWGDGSAADYPAKPIMLVVPSPAGGATDVVARIISESLSRKIGQRIVIENRSGASGAIGARMVASAAADGYTVLFCNSATHGGNPIFMHDPGYDALKDFIPVVRIASVPFILVVNSQLPVNSVKDLIALAKSKPGGLRMGFAGIGSFNHIVGELFQHQTSTEFLAVPYKGTNEVITGVVGGHIDLGFPTPGESLPMIADGRLRALMVTNTKRLPALPNVPSAVELGLRDSVLLGWGGLCVPAGTPPAAVKALNEHTLSAILAQPMRSDLERSGYEIEANNPEAFAQFMRSEIQRIGDLVRQRGIHAEK